MCSADECVIACGSIDGVVARAALQQLLAVAAHDVVVVRAAVDKVVAAAGEDRVGAIHPEMQSASAASAFGVCRFVIPELVAIDGVVASKREDKVAPETSEHSVGRIEDKNDVMSVHCVDGGGNVEAPGKKNSLRPATPM